MSFLPRVQVWRCFEDAAAFWDRAEPDAAHPFQRRLWLEGWHRHIGESERVSPCLVGVSAEDGTPWMLLPLGIQRRGGCVSWRGRAR